MTLANKLYAKSLKNFISTIEEMNEEIKYDNQMSRKRIALIERNLKLNKEAEIINRKRIAEAKINLLALSKKGKTKK